MTTRTVRRYASDPHHDPRVLADARWTLRQSLRHRHTWEGPLDTTDGWLMRCADCYAWRPSTAHDWRDWTENGGEQNGDHH